MSSLEVYLEDGTFNGALRIKGVSRKFVAVRVKRSQRVLFERELNSPGIYILKLGREKIYVGQTNKSVYNRSMESHTDAIQNEWDDIFSFSDQSKTISTDELLYIENAICEYAHEKLGHCITSTPSRENCNERYRKDTYHLDSIKIQECKQYIEEIKEYIEFVKKYGKTVFPEQDESLISTDHETFVPEITLQPQNEERELFYFRNKRRDAEGRAEILIHCGHESNRKAILKAGSRVSVDVRPRFKGAQKVMEKRRMLEIDGKLVDRVLQEDLFFNSQSGAGEFLNGTSFDGNGNWKTVQGNIPLKKLL